jgi:hypothetical protein
LSIEYAIDMDATWIKETHSKEDEEGQDKQREIREA